MRLTDITIKNLPAPENGSVIYYDDDLRGFGVRVSEGGTKSFILTQGRRRQRETLGRVGVVALKQARQVAKEKLAQYTLGHHKPASVRWDAAVDQYLAEVAAHRRSRTHKGYKCLLKKHFHYGDTKLSDISPQELQKDLDKSNGRHSELGHAFAVLRAFLRWAHRKHYLDQNPIERIASPHKYRPRERVLSEDELKRVWIAAGDDTFGKIVKLLILTGQRRGEIASLTRDWCRVTNWYCPHGSAKTRGNIKYPSVRCPNLCYRRVRTTLYFFLRGHSTIPRHRRLLKLPSVVFRKAKPPSTSEAA
jgi:hypothetical protein